MGIKVQINKNRTIEFDMEYIKINKTKYTIKEIFEKDNMGERAIPFLKEIKITWYNLFITGTIKSYRVLHKSYVLINIPLNRDYKYGNNSVVTDDGSGVNFVIFDDIENRVSNVNDKTVYGAICFLSRWTNSYTNKESAYSKIIAKAITPVNVFTETLNKLI